MDLDGLTALLNGRGIEHEILRHTKQLHTAREGADYFGIDIGQTAPTLVVATDKGWYAVILSGDYGRVDMERLKELLSVQHARLAKPDEVEKVTGCRIGSVPLVHQGLPVVLDKSLNRFEYVYGGTGTPQTTLKIRPADLAVVNEVAAFLD